MKHGASDYNLSRRNARRTFSCKKSLELNVMEVAFSWEASMTPIVRKRKKSFIEE